MKKQQKVIELRRAAVLKVAELKTKITFAKSEAAKKRASLLFDRSSELCCLEAGSTERLNVIAKYRAKLAELDAQTTATIARLKAEIQQVKSECERQYAAAEDDQEPEKELQQETVYCDGSEHSARIVARRLIKKLPHIQKGGSICVYVISTTDGEFFVSATEIGHDKEDYVSETFSKLDSEKKEAKFVEKARRLFADEPESGNSHVAEPLSSALDAVFGGNPVEQVDNLVSDTVKDGKEADNE